jgi:diadenosine tetraphosphate (Ap4A) HIT family hydrolase
VGTASDCKFCLKVQAEQPPEGGWVLRNELVSASVIPGSEYPGWFVLHVNRHAEGWMGLTAGEASAVGAACGALARALEQVTGVARVYTYSIGENIPHFHMQIGHPPQQAAERGRRLLGQIIAGDEEHMDRGAALEMAARVAAIVEGAR